MMFLSIPPSHDLRVAAIGLSRKQKRVNYFSLKKKGEVLTARLASVC